MNRWIVVVIVVVAISILALGGFLLWKVAMPKEGSVTDKPASTNPFGNLGSTTHTPVRAQLSLALSDGRTVSVPDFTKENQPEWASATSGYQVAGSATDTFLVTYIPTSDPQVQAQFLVTLFDEPFGANRRAAESALRARLELTDAELCKLDTLVATAPGMSDLYDTQDLGLSFCPGAVPLP